jgi:glycosyltransferase involved in cell wall biosynthesis
VTQIAVLIPCFNERTTIASVVKEFRHQLPEAEIHVFDNSSSDGSAELAAAAGATIHLVPVRGKGQVVRAMFRDAEADAYVMVDADSTYPADRVRDLLAPILQGHADMSVGTRLEQHAKESFRPLHIFGNNLVLETINALFDAHLSDAMSGYRAFSRRFVKTMPVLSHEFEIETEMTLHALEHRMPVVEVSVAYRERPPGSESKLSTFRDGYKVLATVFHLYKHYRPLAFFGSLGLAFIAVGAVAGILVTVEFFEKGQVVGVARAVLAVAFGILGVLSLATGAVLDTVNRRARELYILLADQVVDRRR